MRPGVSCGNASLKRARDLDDLVHLELHIGPRLEPLDVGRKPGIGRVVDRASHGGERSTDTEHAYSICLACYQVLATPSDTPCRKGVTIGTSELARCDFLVSFFEGFREISASSISATRIVPPSKP